MNQLRVVPDPWTQEPEPLAVPPQAGVTAALDYVRNRYGRDFMLDAMLAASVVRPGPLCIVAGI